MNKYYEQSAISVGDKTERLKSVQLQHTYLERGTVMVIFIWLVLLEDYSTSIST